MLLIAIRGNDNPINLKKTSWLKQHIVHHASGFIHRTEIMYSGLRILHQLYNHFLL